MTITAEGRPKARIFGVPLAGCMREVYTASAMEYVLELRREAERQCDDQPLVRHRREKSAVLTMNVRHFSPIPGLLVLNPLTG
jgi:hypothetical protein